MISEILNPWVAHIMRDLCAAGNKGLNKRMFLKLVDRRKKALYLAFCAVYGRGALSKLLTLKVTNLVVARYHYICKHTVLASRPLELMIDPSNSCQLHCPGCVHTDKKEWHEVYKKYWPNGVLSEDYYQKMLAAYAPFSFAVYLCNYGEPMLNKNTYNFIKRAVSYLEYVTVSSNLSLPKLDAEAMVNSGLNMLIMSIDGITQPVYETYRKGGDLKLVMENVEKLVMAKKKLRSNTPYLIWQFLTFKHNVHEVDLAMEKARQMGVDAFHTLTPFDVSADDPSINIVDTGREEYEYFTHPIFKHNSLVENRKYVIDEAEIDEIWNESWLQRMEKLGALDETDNSDAFICGWLYKNITMDAHGRILPCCAPPSDIRQLTYGSINDDCDWFNLPDMCLSRRRGSKQSVKFDSLSQQPPYCLKCPINFEPPHDLWRIQQDLPCIDYRRLLNMETVKLLTQWN